MSNVKYDTPKQKDYPSRKLNLPKTCVANVTKVSKNGCQIESTQIHLTNINPWLDTEHRRYFVAQDTSSHKVHALVVLAQLSSEHGYKSNTHWTSLERRMGQ